MASKQVTVACALLLLVACARGDASEEPSSSQPDVAGRIDIGGYELAYECRGTGSPTVLLEAGYDSPGIATFGELLDPIATSTRVCTYDRAGTGSSDPRPGADGLTVMDQAAELHALLDGAGVEPPYVVVGHSFGGFVSRLFVTTYPEETAGLMLVESSHEDEIEPYRSFYGEGSPDSDWIDGGDLLDIDVTAEVLRAAGHDLGDLPVIAMRAERYEDVLREELWKRTQADLATISSDAILVVALGSGHFVMDENPAAFLAGVQALVDGSRAGRSLASCEEAFATADVECLA